ncbi:MAG: ATP-binding protein [Fibrobacteria bacterium]|nr:ATP-binding protein [Fibrobacteria bacterium]
MKRILLQEVKQNLCRLKMNDMAAELEQALEIAGKNREGHLTFLDNLVKKQVKGVNDRSLQRRIKKADFPEILTFENFDWGFQPGLNVEYVKDLAQLGFIEKRHPLLIFGKTGTGKTHLAIALGIRACEFKYHVAFYTAQDLLRQLHATLLNDTTNQLIAEITRLDLLILDALGFIRTKPEYASLLFDLVNACRQRVSLIVTSNISFEEWGQTMGNPSVTNAIVDRLFEKACLINIRSGRSYRTEGPNAPKLTSE